jgi:hypothetical protein
MGEGQGRPQVSTGLRLGSQMKKCELEGSR